MEVEALIPCGCSWPGPLRVATTQQHAAPPAGLRPGGICSPTTNKSGSFQNNHACQNETIVLHQVANETVGGRAATVSAGSTLETEGGLPLVSVARVETPIPPQLAFSPSSCGTRQMQRFVFAVRSAISTPNGDDVRASAERDYDEAIGNRELRAEHVQAMAELWESGVEVGDDELAKVVNSSLYMVTTGLRAGYNFSCCPTGLASNGWTGVVFRTNILGSGCSDDIRYARAGWTGFRRLRVVA